MDSSQSPYMNAQELAAYLKRPKSYVYKRTMAGKIPVCSDDRLLRFHKDQIDAWLAEQSKPVKKPVSLTRFQAARERLRSLKTEHTDARPPKSDQERTG